MRICGAACAAWIGVVSVTAPALAQQGPGGPPRGVPVRAAPVTVGSISSEVTAVGSLLAEEAVMIRPEIDARISGIQFQEGQQVAKGAVLVTLDAAEQRARLAGSETDVSLNKRRFERAEELYSKNFISQQALDDARENLKRSIARRQEDEALLAKTEIRAPFAGVAGLRLVSPGAYVKAGADIARLEGIGTVKLDFRVPEVYLAHVQAGQQVTLKVDAYPNESFAGRIYAIEPAVDEQTRTVLARARVPNPGARLKPGMFARVSLRLDARDNALLIPEQAIVPRGRESWVFRVVDGKAALTQVQIGLRRPGEVEVIKGVAAGELVVTDGQQKLRDGAPVSVMNAPAPKTAAGAGGKS